MFGQSGKVAQKRVLQEKLQFCKANVPPEDEVISNEQQIRQNFFPWLFKYLTIFAVTIWEKVKLEPPKERSRKLILAVFSIFDPWED